MLHYIHQHLVQYNLEFSATSIYYNKVTFRISTIEKLKEDIFK